MTKKAYVGKVVAKSGFRPWGGFDRVESSPFKTREEAKDWCLAMKDGNESQWSHSVIREVSIQN